VGLVEGRPVKALNTGRRRHSGSPAPGRGAADAPQAVAGVTRGQGDPRVESGDEFLVAGVLVHESAMGSPWWGLHCSDRGRYP